MDASVHLMVRAERCSWHYVHRHTLIGGNAPSEFSMRGSRSDSININGYTEILKKDF